MLKLRYGDYQLELMPEHGGAVGRFDWRSSQVFRTAVGTDPLDTSSFPLVPFSNRIRDGKFNWQGRDVRLSQNMPGIAHPLHGLGWLVPWDVLDHDEAQASLAYSNDGSGEWPWAFRAEQRFLLDETGLTMRLSLTNQSSERMPAGLGFHPYFPCDGETRYLGLHRGEWHNDEECLPTRLDLADVAKDWWDGNPVSTRSVDTAYTQRAGALEIIWPDKNRRVRISPSASLPFTLVFTPKGADYFCVEPVSHMTDAVNRDGPDTGLIALEPGASVEVSVHLEMFENA